jgi:hypothetical protein
MSKLKGFCTPEQAAELDEIERRESSVQPYWMRCKTCGSHVMSDARIYRVCDGDPETGDHDCQLERIDRPVLTPAPSEKLQQGTPHTVAWVASVISENPLIASLLYDIDLLPEQIKEGDERRYNYMLAVIGHMKAALSATGRSDEIAAEVERAVAKFPTWPTDPLHALAVLGEEFGELTKAMVQLTYEPHKTSAGEVKAEAIQTAAMALRLYRSLDLYEYRPGVQHKQAAPDNRSKDGKSA